VCILVNAGLVPKFGPYRIHAELARRLAGIGLHTLRFDLGGIGDSPLAPSGLPLRERTEMEVTAAVDFVAMQYPACGIVIGGLCSGAADAFRHAETDTRITGVLLMDPFGWKAGGGRWRRVRRQLAGRVFRALSMRRPIPLGPGSTRDSAHPRRSLINYKYMDHEESSRILRTLIDRGVRTHFVYTGGMRDHFHHPGQLAAMFPGIDFRDLVTVDHFPHTDHTQLLQEDRDALLSATVGRLAQHIAVGA
jgi:hypothetical protein